MAAVRANLFPLSHGGLPLHRKAAEVIRRLTTSPEYAKGGLLPDEMTIANRLGVSRGTARLAISHLVAEGVLERRAGVGTRVVQRAAESAIGAWRSFSREMARQGIQIQMFRSQLREAPATEAVASELRIKPGTVVQRLDRVRGWDDVPVLRARSWFHPRVRFSEKETFSRPLYDLIADTCGLIADRAKEALSAESATAVLARDLCVKKGSPLLRRRHTVLDIAGRPFEFSEVHYVSDRFTLTLDLRREAS